MTLRCQSSQIWVSPLTLLYWFFDLAPVAEAKPYLKAALNSQRPQEVADAIYAAREQMTRIQRQDIPI